jgi:hypothetical protein
VAPRLAGVPTRRYLPDTNVLETRWASAAGCVVLLDCMAVADGATARTPLPEHEILRTARCERGEVELEVVLDARPGFGRTRRRWRDAGALGLHLATPRELVALRSEPAVRLADDGVVRGRIRLRAGESAPRWSASGLHPRMAGEHRGPTAPRQLEPPGFMALHYGYQTPASVLVAHVVYGAILGGFYRA